MLSYIKLVAPALTTIDHLVLSHPHTDHVELMADLFGAYTVRQVWDSGRLLDGCGYRAFVTAIHDHPDVQYHNALQDLGTRDYAFAARMCSVQLPETTVTLKLSSMISTGTPITLGQAAAMTILHANGSDQVTTPNENSLVVRLDLGPTRVLFMGDAQAGGRASPSTPPSATFIEGKLLACCPSDLAANVMIVGHHGSKTSSRKALLDAVNASVFVVSSGPKKYGSPGVVLPDAEIINELQSRGQVFRTDMDDTACATNPKKVGPDNDGQAGGCDNVRITITGTMIQPEYFHGSEP
jgi:competence protein ComEC